MPRPLTAAIAVLAFALAGCGGNESSGGPTKHVSHAAPSPVKVSGHTTVSMTEFAFKPNALATTAGKLKVTAKNDGSTAHEFMLLRTKKAPDALPVKQGVASVTGAVGEIPEQKPGASASHTFKLKAGRYVFICNLPGHYQAGMYGGLTVK
jgi:uncharacterized cupredoxin-like copper-binding protein